MSPPPDRPGHPLKTQLFRSALVGITVSLVLAAGSLGIQKPGPEMGEFGSVCGPTGDQPCYRPLLTAGWPIGYVVDRPDLPVQDRLGFEDDIRPAMYLLDALFYFALLSIAWRYGQIRRRSRQERRNRTLRRG